jgi:PAS domain S-box-containing protein
MTNLTSRTGSAYDFLILLLEQSEDIALILMDTNGNITDWFQGATHVFGFTAEEMVGQPALRIFTPEDIQRGASAHEFVVAKTIGRSEDERWHIRKDGTRFWGSGVLISVRQSSGELLGFAKIVRNRTDGRAQTEALENQIRHLGTTAENHRKFLATFAHELRNPLASLTNALALLRMDYEGREDRSDVFALMERQILLSTRLIDDSLDFIRAGGTGTRLKSTIVDLTQIAKRSFETVQPQAIARQQRFEILAIGGAVRVQCDPQRIDQVIVNLLNNAIKYTPPGGRVTFSISVEDSEAVMRVEDTGVGMSADILPWVFEIFTRDESAHETSPEGIGVGLALVRELVTLHGGTVQARSDGRNKGSMFVVRLPLAPSA